MESRPLHTEEDYRAALAGVSALVHLFPESGTPEGDALEVLIILVERYEAEHFPIEAIRFWMEQGGLSVSDMKPYIGSPNRVYEVLRGKRPSSLGMTRHLHEGLQIQSEVLVAERTPECVVAL